jgi:hypothetical protein
MSTNISFESVIAEFVEKIEQEYSITIDIKIVESFVAKGKNLGKAKKSKKEVKDPNAPKRAKSAYIFFCADKRSAIAENNPEMKASIPIPRPTSSRWPRKTPRALSCR